VNTICVAESAHTPACSIYVACGVVGIIGGELYINGRKLKGLTSATKRIVCTEVFEVLNSFSPGNL
jgi:hypothetical protein